MTGVLKAASAGLKSVATTFLFIQASLLVGGVLPFEVTTPLDLLATQSLFAAPPGVEGDIARNIPELDGRSLSPLWALPFLGILLSIAIFPLKHRRFWERHYGKVSLFWSLIVIVGIALSQGLSTSLYAAIETMVHTFMPFICLLLALFTVTGGIKFHGTFSGSPRVNLLILLVGSALSSWIGTTGAAVLLIRPLLQANMWRMYKVHTIVFFIFLVGNIGGTLTPVGNPPLLMGFIKKVDFFWPTLRLLPSTFFAVAVLLAVYYAVDTYIFRREPPRPYVSPEEERFSIEGKRNLALVPLIVAAAFFSSVEAGTAFVVHHVDVPVSHLVEVSVLLGITFVSVAITRRETREKNNFTWGPIQEVAKLFAGIFITMAPLIAMLQAGSEGPLGIVIRSLSDSQGNAVNPLYFWLSGLLSGFLDSAPAYLVFFNTASAGQGQPAQFMMTTAEDTLIAISAGASFMGALSYIGNAPNMMVKAIAEENEVVMPSFFGYCAWAFGILTPLFILITVLFIH